MSKGYDIYTDGSSVNEGGVYKGGWGVAVEVDGGVFTMYGPSGDGGTNNKAELHAADYGHKLSAYLPGDKRFKIDSKYVINGITSYLSSWKKNKWRTKQGEPVKNIDEWKAMDQTITNVSGRHPIDWVKGHSGVAGNEAADEAARLGRLMGNDGYHYGDVRYSFTSDTLPAFFLDFAESVKAVRDTHAIAPGKVRDGQMTVLEDSGENAIWVNDRWVTMPKKIGNSKIERPNAFLTGKRLVYLSNQLRTPCEGRYWYSGVSFNRDTDKPSRNFGSPSADYHECTVASKNKIQALEDFIDWHNDAINVEYQLPVVLNIHTLFFGTLWGYIESGAAWNGISDFHEGLALGERFTIADTVYIVEAVPYIEDGKIIDKSISKLGPAKKALALETNRHGDVVHPDGTVQAELLTTPGLAFIGIDGLQKRERMTLSYLKGGLKDITYDITDTLFTATPGKGDKVTWGANGSLSDSKAFKYPVNINSGVATLILLTGVDLPQVVDLNRIARTFVGTLKATLVIHDVFEKSVRHSIIIEDDENIGVYGNPYSNITFIKSK